VHPRAKKTALAGKLGGVFKLHLNAPPVEGRANDACIRFFAELAGVPPSRVRILSGLTNRTKVVDIDGVSQKDLEEKLPK
jgi:uncharacterized protein YggU (UPF0235/DUF167 family)